MKHKYTKLSLIALAFGMTMLTSCNTTQELAYFKDAPRDVEMEQSGQFSKGIQTNDLLYIYVESRAPEATVRFNQETNKIAVDGGVVMNPGASAVTGYLVNNDGDIIFPVLGRIHVVGKTHAQLAAELEQRLVGEGHILDCDAAIYLCPWEILFAEQKDDRRSVIKDLEIRIGEAGASVFSHHFCRFVMHFLNQISILDD